MTKLSAAQVDEMATLREQGWSYHRLADRYDVSPGAIHYRCLTVGALSPRSRRLPSGGRRVDGHGFGGRVKHFTEAEDERLLRLARTGATVEAIAVALGRARTSVRIRLMTLELKEELT